MMISACKCYWQERSTTLYARIAVKTTWTWSAFDQNRIRLVSAPQMRQYEPPPYHQYVDESLLAVLTAGGSRSRETGRGDGLLSLSFQSLGGMPFRIKGAL